LLRRAQLRQHRELLWRKLLKKNYLILIINYLVKTWKNLQEIFSTFLKNIFSR
jgi:hypothetical protein